MIFLKKIFSIFLLFFFLAFGIQTLWAKEDAIIKVSGTYLSHYEVYDMNNNKISTHYTKDEFDIPVGTYKIVLNGTSAVIHAIKGINNLPVSTINLNGSYNNHYYLYDKNDLNSVLATQYTKNGFDIFPGIWTLAVNGSYATHTFKPGVNDFSVAIIELNGSSNNHYSIFDNEEATGKPLAKIYTREKLDIFPGKWTLKVNGSYITHTFKQGSNDFAVAVIKLNGSSNNHYSIFDDDEAPLATIYTREKLDIFPGKWTLKVNGSYITHTFEHGINNFSVSVINLNGSTNNHYSIYDNEDATGNALATIYTREKLDIFPGSWTLKVNGSYITHTFEHGINNFSVSVINLNGSTNNHYSIYDNEDATGNALATIYTREKLDIFPGKWTLKVNGSYITHTFKHGINDFSVAVINLNGSTNNHYSIYDNEDATGNALATIYTREKLDIFPGLWTLKLNGSIKTNTFSHGVNNFSVAILSFKCESIKTFYVYDKEISDSQLFSIDSKKKIDIFPGSYIIEDNNQSKNVLLYEGENLFDCNIVRISPEPKNSVSGCVTFKNEPMHNSSIMIIQSGQYHKQSKLDSNGCFSIDNIPDETPFSIFIRSKK